MIITTQPFPNNATSARSLSLSLSLPLIEFACILRSISKLPLRLLVVSWTLLLVLSAPQLLPLPTLVSIALGWSSGGTAYARVGHCLRLRR